MFDLLTDPQILAAALFAYAYTAKLAAALVQAFCSPRRRKD